MISVLLPVVQRAEIEVFTRTGAPSTWPGVPPSRGPQARRPSRRPPTAPLAPRCTDNGHTSEEQAGERSATNSEKSYRGTLIGMRHGIDLVELTGAVAREHGDIEFADWCDQWLERRRPLVEAAARELAWFAANPERATDPARLDSPVARGLHAFIRGCQHLAERLRRPEDPRLQSAPH